jgi:hypothetical protein
MGDTERFKFIGFSPRGRFKYDSCGNDSLEMSQNGFLVTCLRSGPAMSGDSRRMTISARSVCSCSNAHRLKEILQQELRLIRR